MTDVLIPGGRDVRGTIEEPDGGAGAIVVACPPHPEHGGSRSDPRLSAVGDVLGESGIACLRFDYGAWDEGYGELADVRNAVRWGRDRYDRVGLFGYSFGASLAVLAAAELSDLGGVFALAPTARLTDTIDVVAALEDVDAPLAVAYGSRDSTADWEPIVDRARERGDRLLELPADHFFLGTREEIASESRAFFEDVLCP